MTRFKELKRIETALEYSNKKELQWALQYCRMRLGIVTMKYHEKHWHKLIKKVETELAKIEEKKGVSTELCKLLHYAMEVDACSRKRE